MRYPCILGVVVLLALLACSAAAQPGEMQKGIRIGLSMSNTSGDDLADGINEEEGSTLEKKSRLGICGGFFLTFPVSPTFAIQPELLYTQKGIKIEGPEGDGKFGINYIEVPVLAKYLFPSSGTIQPALFAGPVLGFKAGTSISFDAADPADQLVADEWVQWLEEMADDYLSGTDFGLAFGGSLNFDSFVVDLRYTLGLSNLIDTDEAVDISTKNNAFNISVGMMF